MPETIDKTKCSGCGKSLIGAMTYSGNLCNGCDTKKQSGQEIPANQTSPMLIQCPACGNDVSREAEQCPKCAYPVKANMVEKPFARKMIKKVVVIFGIALVLIMISPKIFGLGAFIIMPLIFIVVVIPTMIWAAIKVTRHSLK